MKKIILCMVIAMTVFSASSFAQGGGGGGERFKQMLKDSLSFTDVQIDTVMAVRQSFQPQRREIMMDQAMTPEDKKTKMAAINLQMRARLKGTLTDDQMDKLDALQMRMMERGRNRGGGNR